MKTNYIPEELQRLMHEAFERKRNATNIPLVSKVRISREPITEVDRKTEEVRRNTEPHSVESCGGCVGFYNQTGKLVRHNGGVETCVGRPAFLAPLRSTNRPRPLSELL